MQKISAAAQAAWKAADALRSNSGLAPSEYYLPVLGLIFLRGIDENTYERISQLNKDVGQALDAALKMAEERDPRLSNVLLQCFAKLDDSLLKNLTAIIDEYASQATGDSMGQLYEYFLDHFHSGQAQDDGAFFTPECIVRLIEGVLNPAGGILLDPACGSGGMFVHMSRPGLECCGQDKNASTLKVAAMNAALRVCDFRLGIGNTYYEDVLGLEGCCDYVASNPPFNAAGVESVRALRAGRLPYGLPDVNSRGEVKNANYLWIQYFYTYLKEGGRGAFVMPCSALNSKGRDGEIRGRMIEDGCVEAIVSVGSKFFHNRSLPCCLWFISRETDRNRQILFIDGSSFYRERGRSLRYWDSIQLKTIISAILLFRSEKDRFATVLEGCKQDLADLLDEVITASQKYGKYHYYDSFEYWKDACQSIREEVNNIECCGVTLAEKLRKLSSDISASLEELVRVNEWSTSQDKKELFDKIRKRADINKLNNRQILAQVRREAASAVSAAEHCLQYMNDMEKLKESFAGGVYGDVPGFCASVSIETVRQKGYSLDPAAYVGAEATDSTDTDCQNRFRMAVEDLDALDEECRFIMDGLRTAVKELLKDEQ